MTAPYDASYPPVSPVTRPPQIGRARAALVAGILIVAFQLAGNAFSYLLPSIMNTFDFSASDYYLLFLPFQVVEILLAVAALVLGIPPLAGPGPRGVAGIGVGIAGAAIVQIAFGYALGALAPLLY